MTHCQKPETNLSSCRSRAKGIIKICLEDVLKKEDGLSDLAFRKEPALQHVFANSLQAPQYSACSLWEKTCYVQNGLPSQITDANLKRLVFVKGNRHLAGDK